MAWSQPSSKSHRLLFWSLAILAVVMVLVVAFALRRFNREMRGVGEGEKEGAGKIELSQQKEKDDPAQLSFCDDKSGDDLEACRSAVRDGQVYTQALKQINMSFCDEIHDEELRGVCKESVRSGQLYVKKEDPDSYARVLMRGGDVKGAVSAFETLVKEKGESGVSVDILADLALAYGNLALQQVNNRDVLISKAEHVLEVAKKREPDNVQIPLVYGHLSEVKGDVFSALAFYDHVLTNNSSQQDALVGRGHAYSMIGMIDLAVEDFKKAETLDASHENSRIYSNLCRILSGDESRYSEAFSYCDRVLQIPSVSSADASEARAIQGNIALHQGDTTLAWKYLSEAETLYPNDPNIKIMFARLFRLEGKFSQALQSAQEVIAMNNKKAVAYEELAYALFQLGQKAEAEQAAKTGLAMVDTDISLLYPSKSVEKRSFYSILADIYQSQGNVTREAEMRKLAENVMSSSTLSN